MHRRVSLLLAVALCLACAEPAATVVDPRPLIDQEISRLESVVDEIDRSNLPEPLVKRLEENRELLGSLRSAEEPLLRLYLMREPFVEIETTRFLASNRGASASIEALEQLWTEHRSEFEVTLDEHGDSVSRALAEIADTRAKRLFHASLQYGRISSPSSGLYYLAEAEANRRYLDFLRGLEPEREEMEIDRADLEAAARAIESEARAVLEADPTSRAMIPVSVRLDEAREMIETDMLAGARLMILEARLELKRRVTEGKESVSAAVEPSGDGSFSTLLAAMAREHPIDEVRRIARTDLIPLDESLRDAGLPANGSSQRVVTLTLVRWPYT